MTEHSERCLDQETIQTVETEVDNVAPKIVGLLGLGPTANVQQLRDQLVEACNEYKEKLFKPSKKELKQGIDVQITETDGEMQAYIIPNAGATANMNSKKQRVIFRAINREDVYDVLDVAKVADLVLITMSCANVD